MRKSKTHFEQIPLEKVKKIVEEKVSKKEQSGTEDITDLIDDVPAKDCRAGQEHSAKEGAF